MTVSLLNNTAGIAHCAVPRYATMEKSINNRNLILFFMDLEMGFFMNTAARLEQESYQRHESVFMTLINGRFT